MAEPPGTLVYNPLLDARLHLLRYSAVDSPPLPIYSDLMEGFAQVLRRRIRMNYQNVIGVIGGTGSGKSSWALQECFMVDRYFTLQGNYIYDTSDLATKLAQPKGAVSPVNFFDEGSVILNSSRHSTKQSTDIVVLFDTMRSRGMTSFICIPELRSLNNRIREDHLNYLVVCGEKAPDPKYQRRGFFKLFMRTRPSTFSNSVFWKPLGWGIYKPLKPKLDAEYQDYKRRAQDRLLDDFYERNAAGEV